MKKNCIYVIEELNGEDVQGYSKGRNIKAYSTLEKAQRQLKFYSANEKLITIVKYKRNSDFTVKAIYEIEPDEYVCSKCGCFLQDYFKYCPKCGGKIGGVK